MKALITNPLFCILMCSLMGYYLGKKIGYRHFRLGSAAALFVGLAVSYFMGRIQIEAPLIPPVLLEMSLMAFIAAVGLKASTNIRPILKAYGSKFIFLAIAVTSVGAFTTYLLVGAVDSVKYEIIGTYVGALTSSPGLATALELANGLPGNPSADIGLGYAIAYIPGVLIVILFAQVFARKFKTVRQGTVSKQEERAVEGFHLGRFLTVLAMGAILGSVEINIGMRLPFSLGLTGGTLISALVMGSRLPGFAFNERTLETIKEMGLYAFLSIVGIKYGFEAVTTIGEVGLQLLIIGMFTGIMSLLTGLIIGRYVLKIDAEILLGGICGGMTSTPGLAAAIEAFDSDDVAVGYGATYPFAMIAMMIFTNLLFG